MSASVHPAPEDATLEAQYAGFVTRLIAFTIDILIINLVTLVMTGVSVLIFGFFNNVYSLIPGASKTTFEELVVWITSATAIVTLIVMVWLYPVFFWMINGQTIGKRIMGLRVVRMDGLEMTFWRGLLRVFGYWISALPLFFGFAWILFSNKRRGWHDIITNTCVIYSWEARGSTAFQDSILRTSRDLRRRRGPT